MPSQRPGCPRAAALAKRHGFSDAAARRLRGMPEAVVRGVRHALGVRPVYKTVDTCAAEFAAQTPYHYSSYDEENEVAPRERPAVIILGSGPNRIGQGVEFDYSCVHASFALREAGYDTVMVNCNPETVSTDYDTSSRLYFEPLTLEDVLEVVHAERAGRPDRRASSSSSAARPRSGWPRRSRTRACRSSARRPRRSTSPRTAARSAGCSPRPACPRPSTARLQRRRGRRDRRRDRLPGARAAVLRARRARMEIVYDDETLADLRRAGHHRQPGAPDARRPLPRRRDRDRRRRALRRRRDVSRRRHGAHRGGRHPLRRQACTLPPVTLGAPRARAGARPRPASSPRASGCAG
jgi:carbamoyl-phosphate synthase large subunit